MNNYAESLFDSISLIVENRLAGLDYDKTIVCTIISDKNAKNDIYTVTDGSIQFEAFGQGNTYNINERVRVEVSNNDWSKPKYIQGKYSTSDDTKPITYVSPLESILQLTNNFMSVDSQGIFGIAANLNTSLNTPSTIPIGRVELNDTDINNIDIFNSLYIKGEFQTNFDQYEMRSGDYGLLLVLSSVENNKNQAIKFSATKDMIGNIYSFKIFTGQEKVYQLSAESWSKGLTWIDVYLYEDNNFTYYDNETQSIMNFPLNKIDDTTISNIKVKNLTLGFGSELHSIDDNNIKIYTNNTNTFTVKTENPTNPDIKNIKLLWYNKTENNEYVGFSDGKYDPSYDEIEYLNAVRLNERLLKYKSNDYYDDKLSLSIAADGADIESIGQIAYNIIGKDLFNSLTGFSEYIKNINNDIDNLIREMLDNSQGAGENSLGKIANQISEDSQKLNKNYAKILQAAKKKEIAKKDDNTNIVESDIQIWHTNIINSLQLIFNLFGYAVDVDNKIIYLEEDKHDKIIPGIQNSINTQYVNYTSIFTSYKTTIERILNQLLNQLIKLQELLVEDDSTNLDKLLELNSGNYNYVGAYVDQKEDAAFQDRWNNRYCIYWYRQTLGYTDPNGIMPPGWERIVEQTNKGIPAEDANNPGYCQKRAGAADCEFVLNRYITQEKIKAVLFYNHEKYISKELEFLNTEKITDKASIDLNGALSIEHYHNDSKDSYQLYSANGLLINAAEAQKRRQLRIRFDGETGGDEQLIGATVYWYVPKNSTMLTVFDIDINDFYTDKIKRYNSLTEFTNYYKRNLITNYAASLVRIKKANEDGEGAPAADEWSTYVTSQDYLQYSNSYLSLENLNGNTNDEIKKSQQIVQNADNIFKYDIYEYDGIEWKNTGNSIDRFVITSISYANDDDAIEEQLADPTAYKPGYYCYFKEIGSNDDNTVKVEDTLFSYHINNYYRQTATQNGIFCEVKKNNTTYYANKHFSFSSFGNSGTDYTLTILPDPLQNVVMSEHPLSIDICLYDYNNNILPIDNNINISWEGPTGYDSPVARLDPKTQALIGCIVTKTQLHNYYAGILKCIANNVIIDNLNKKVNLTSYLPIPYSDNLNQYIEGANTIIYNSNGSDPQYYKQPYKLYNSINNTLIPNVTWDIEYYCTEKTYNNITFSKFTINNNTIIAHGHDRNGITQDLAITDSDIICSLSIGYLPKLDINNVLQPCIMYTENLNIYPVVVAKDTSNKVLWAQPLLIIKNRYSSPMINSWDGELKIDEENNAILSLMMGAGRKNTENQFEGILMGDVRAVTGDESVQAVGLYGYHKGEQSFGFKVDGTGFIGKSSKGRILFNGDSSTITSSSFETTGTGMKLDLDDGWLSIKNNGTEIIKLNNQNTSPYLQIKNKFLKPETDNEYEEKVLINIADNDYYLQSSDYIPDSKGMKIDLQDGHIDAYNFTLTSGNFILNSNGINAADGDMANWYNSYVPMPEDENEEKGKIIFKANDLFAVTNNGYLFADDIYANTKGQIGGWEIDGYRLLAKKEGDIRHAGMAANSGHGCWAFWAGAQSGNGYDNYDSEEAGILAKYPDEGFYWDADTRAWYIDDSKTVKLQPYGFDAPFHVGHAGELYAEKGQIGPFEFTDTGMRSTYIELSAKEIKFPLSSQFNLNDKVLINTDPNTQDAFITTKTDINFTIQNLAGAGIQFYNDTGTATQDIHITIMGPVGANSPGSSVDLEWVINSSGNDIWHELRFPYTVTIDGYVTTPLTRTFKIRYFDIRFNETITFEETFTLPANQTTLNSYAILKTARGGIMDGEYIYGPYVQSDNKYYNGSTGIYTQTFKATNTCDILVGTYSKENNVLYSLGHFAPLSEDCSATLGINGHMWGRIFLQNLDGSSDARLKNSITNINEKFNLFFDNLKPVGYKYNNGTSGRQHFGFIAQDLRMNLDISNIDSIEFAGVCYPNSNEEYYTVRYLEFIPLNTWQIQKLKPRMTEAEERIYKLEQELKELKQQLL